ncbi:MAG: MFS transporter [Stellaceae bacterium]
MILGMFGSSSFAALLPNFETLWRLSNTEAGWISALFFAGYVAAVPLLVGSTDQVDPRRIYLFSLLLGAAASVAYALLAQGFWSAAIIRGFAGMGLAGTYMPGLKLLTDRYDGPRQARYIAYYTAGFSFGTAFSFAFTGEVTDWLGWRATFWGAAAGSLAALALIQILVPPDPPVRAEGAAWRRLAFRPVFKNRTAMAFVLGYAGHTFELFALRGWLNAYLIYADRVRGGSGDISNASWLSTLTVLVGTVSSIYGAEVAARADRRRVIGRVMILSVLASVAAGFSSGLPVWAVTALCCLYSMLIMADSAALTGGAVVSAAAGQRGATLAVHSVLGFSGGVFGPLAVGLVLDLAGGGTGYLAWGLAFVTMGAGSLAALFAIRGL